MRIIIAKPGVRHILYGLSLVAGLAVTTSAAAQTLYGGLGRGSASDPGAIMTVDQTNGAGTLVGDPVTPGGLTGLAFDSSGRLWGSSIDGPAGSRVSRLVEIDPVTGGLISSVPILDGATPMSIGDLAVQPGTDTIFGVSSNSNSGTTGGQIFTIDTTGAATFVGDTFQGRSGGLGFAPDATFYYLEFNQLHILDPTNANILNTVNLDFGGHDGLAVRPSDGVLYATGAGVGSQQIRVIDPVAGTSTLIGLNGIGSASDLAFQPVAVFAKELTSGPTNDSLPVDGPSMWLEIGGGIANGGFEDPNVCPAGFVTKGIGGDLGDWSITAGTIDHICAYWTPSEGAQSVDMTGNAAATITQQLNGLDAGRDYRVTFMMAGNPAGGPAIKTMEVDVDGGQIASFEFDVTSDCGGGCSLASMGWTEKVYEFTASASDMDLTFTSLTGGFYGPALDDVKLFGEYAINLAVEVGQEEPTFYDFDITYVDPANPDVVVDDHVPAEWHVIEIQHDGTGLPLGCGEETGFSGDYGEVDVFRGGKAGKDCQSDTGLAWLPPADGATINVQTEARCHDNKNNTKCKPTSCGGLYLNYGAVAYDAETGEVVAGPTDPLCLAAVSDVDGDGGIDYTGGGDEDGDGLADLEEACGVGTDPCVADTDGDGVEDGIDECPLEGPPDASAGEVLDPNGCIRQSQCSDGIDNDDDGPIDYPADASCETIDDDSEDSADCPCWSSSDLLNVTAANILIGSSCSSRPDVDALIQNIGGSTPGLEGGFAADLDRDGVPACYTRDFPPGFLAITLEEGQACIDQIAARCAAVGDPIPVAPAASEPAEPGRDIFSAD